MPLDSLDSSHSCLILYAIPPTILSRQADHDSFPSQRPPLAGLHEMICDFLDERIDEIEEHYSTLSNNRLQKLQQENALLQERIGKKNREFNQLQANNQKLETDLSNAWKKINLLQQERAKETIQYQREKTQLAQMLVNTREGVKSAIQDCMQQVRQDSEQRIADLENQLMAAQLENQMLKESMDES
jgi:SMC interacting uncharacterized protein involved in chromosome segregation